MLLWLEWYRCVSVFRPSCKDKRTWVMFVLIMVGLAVREEVVGVTSIVRALGLADRTYKCLLHFFHSRAFNLEAATRIWLKFVFARFSPVEESGFCVLLGDGIKVGKEGKKMPAVKSLHQESNDNTKPEYIMGHSFQALAFLAQACQNVFAVPLISRIHEGIVRSNRDQRTTVDHMAQMLRELICDIGRPIIFVADNFYGNEKIIRALKLVQSFVVSRLRSNATAEHPAQRKPKAERGPGRPPTYGEKVSLAKLFRKRHLFTEAPSPVYGEDGVDIRYYCINLLWRPVGDFVRFVLVAHPSRGNIILMTTKLDLDPLRVIALYGYRWKIEVSFKVALHVIGAYAYHFWMKEMDKIRRGSGDQYLHRKSKDYRDQVTRKVEAYHRFVQLGCIAHGLHQYLAATMMDQVWGCFRSWLRTMKKHQMPSELVTSYALRSSLPGFLLRAPEGHDIAKFLSMHADPERMLAKAMVA